jgi:hypothetical protein
MKQAAYYASATCYQQFIRLPVLIVKFCHLFWRSALRGNDHNYASLVGSGSAFTGSGSCVLVSGAFSSTVSMACIAIAKNSGNASSMMLLIAFSIFFTKIPSGLQM